MNKSDYYLGNKNVPIYDAEFNYSIEQIEDLKKCHDDVQYFAEKYFTIVDLDMGKTLIKLHKFQKRILTALSKYNRVVVLSSRQSGKTTLMTIYSLWLTCFNHDKRVMIIANKEQTAISILKRIRLAYELLPNWLKPGAKEYGKTEITFANDSSIIISTTTSTAARGESVNCLFVDECAFISPTLIDDFWKSTIPIISSSKTAKIFIVSSPNGTGNKFYEIYSKAASGQNKEWHHERIDWWEIPGRDDIWKEKMIKTLGSKEAFNQEFGNVFFETGELVVDQDILNDLKSKAKPPEYTLDVEHYKIWKTPEPGRIYSIGVDIGEGIGRAGSVVNIMDITDLTNIEQVAIYHNTLIDPYNFAKVVYDIANQWGKPPLAIERNACGAQVIDSLCEVHKYNNIICYGTENTKERVGIYSHTNSKFTGIMNMRYWMNNLKCVIINDLATLNEFDTFIRHPNGTWKHKGGEEIYDDRVLAVIWSLLILVPEICERYYDILNYDDKGRPLAIKQFVIEDSKFYKIPELAAPYSDNAYPVFFGSQINQRESEIIRLNNSGYTIL